MNNLATLKILIRGAGEMASSAACRLFNSGFQRIVMTEVSQPLAVRRGVSFCDAVRYGWYEVEQIKAVKIDNVAQAEETWKNHLIPILVYPKNIANTIFRPDILVDAVMAKKNTGVHISDSPLVIALGPGFLAGRDAHCVIETNRGHNLGQLLYEGQAIPDTGIPGSIEGYTSDRVLRAPIEGQFLSERAIGDIVQAGDIIGQISNELVSAKIAGVVRGLISSGFWVTQGLKIGDIDPRGIVSHCFTISDKARAVAGSVLEAILRRYNN